MLSNKAPVWSYENQSYVLNFHGRVTRVRHLLINNPLHLQSISFQASVKNFQMEIEPGNVIMQFGRVGTDTFTMDFRWVVNIDNPVLSSDWDWDLGLGTWDLGPGTWDLGPGAWDLGLGPGKWEMGIESTPSPRR